MAHLAGADKKIPTVHYIDGVDQTSILLTDNGNNHREHVYTWLGTEFMSLRIREYKLHLQVMQSQTTATHLLKY